MATVKLCFWRKENICIAACEETENCMANCKKCKTFYSLPICNDCQEQKREGE